MLKVPVMQNINISHEKFNAFLLLISVFITVTPELNRNCNKVVWLIVLILWHFDSFFLYKRREYFNGKLLYLFLASWFLYDIVLRFIGFSTASIGNYFNLLIFYDMLIKSLFVLQYYSNDTKNNVFMFIQVIVLFNLISNIFVEFSIENVHEKFYYNMEMYKGKNIAMTEFYNMLSFFVGINIVLFFKSKKKSQKSFCLFLVVLSLFFMCSIDPRVTALSMLLLFCFVLFFLDSKNSVMFFLKIICSICICLFLFIVFYDTVINLLPNRIRVRIIALFESPGFSSNVYLSRFKLMSNSLNTFISSPKRFLIGVGLHVGDEYRSLIGQHSLITDYMAEYGCLGIFFIFTLFFLLYKKFHKYAKSKFEKVFLISILFVLACFSILSNTFKAELVVSSLLSFALLIKN